jgi:hypothetical protein
MPRRAQPGAHDIAAEIVRRANRLTASESHVILLSDPPTAQERLQLLAAGLQDIPFMVGSRHCMTEDEWVERYCGD